jgi:hypothetical protein
MRETIVGLCLAEKINWLTKLFILTSQDVALKTSILALNESPKHLYCGY